MSVAYSSSLDISFDIRGGLFMRQVHHWSALLFVASMSVHMLRVFFTGAFRKPRELNWVVGFVLLILAMAAGFTGYSLPDDLLSGNGLRIIDGVIKSIPVVGTYISFFLFGGEFPGTMIIGRLYMLHILLVPALILLMIVHAPLHGGCAQAHAVPRPRPQRRQRRRLPPGSGLRGEGRRLLLHRVRCRRLMAAFFTINPIWNYGPYDPSPVSAGTQPDWYIGFVDGALRLMPGTIGDWKVEQIWFGHMFTFNVLLPALVPAGILFTVMFTYPWIERWITKDNREHHVLDRPRNAPTRTAIGVAGFVWYCVMWAAAGSDLIATHFHVALNDVTYWLRALFFIGPVIAFIVTKRVALALQRKDREIALHGRETGRIVRLPHGEFIEVHAPLDEYKRYKLVGFESPAPLPAVPNDHGVVGRKEKRPREAVPLVLRGPGCPGHSGRAGGRSRSPRRPRGRRSGRVSEDAEPLGSTKQYRGRPVPLGTGLPLYL